MRISDWSSDVCSSDLRHRPRTAGEPGGEVGLSRGRTRVTAEAILSKSVAVFVILAIVFGLCSWLAGQVAARSWRPMRLALAYSVLIAMADRFLLFALRDASLLDPVGFALALVMFSTITALAFRWNQMDMMISQYPW